MRVVKKFGFAHVTFMGLDKAIDTLTRIHKAYSERGYGIVLPDLNNSNFISMLGVGKVSVHRDKEDLCHVTFVEGTFKSTFRKIFSRE